jgi:predicted metal-binding protein
VVAPYECLSACTRPCVVALRAPGKYTYVFGDMAPMKSEHSIVECAALYADRPDGFLNREDRPPTMRAAILARVPPDFDD